MKRAQHSALQKSNFQTHQLQLNLQLNSQRMPRTNRRRVSGLLTRWSSLYCQACLPSSPIHTKQRNGLTMAKVREKFWEPRLRRLTKFRRSCNGCKKFEAKAYQVPPSGTLPMTRTQGSIAFQVVGVNFPGPIRFQQSPKKEGKAYLVLYACSLTRAVHLDLLSSLQTSDFLASLRRFIAPRGRPENIYSDNKSTFELAAKWLQKVHIDEKCHAFLAENSIKWKFNLSRAPWWGGQFDWLLQERILQINRQPDAAFPRVRESRVGSRSRSKQPTLELS